MVGTPIFDQGTDTYTTLTQVAAEELHVSPDEVEIEVWNTDAIPFDSGVAGSRATRINTIVAYDAAQRVKDALITLAARLFECAPESLTFEAGHIRRADRDESISWRELLDRTGESVSGQANIEAEGRSKITSFAAQVAEVSVDPDTGEVKLLNFTTAHDIGRIINPISHQGQIEGADYAGAGLRAERRAGAARRAASLTCRSANTKCRTMPDMPPLKTVLLESQLGVGAVPDSRHWREPLHAGCARHRQRRGRRHWGARAQPANHLGEGLRRTPQTGIGRKEKPMDLTSLRDEYDLARRYTQALYEDLSEADVQWRPSAQSSSIAWHLGHQAAAAHFVLRNLINAEASLNPAYDALVRFRLGCDVPRRNAAARRHRGVSRRHCGARSRPHRHGAWRRRPGGARRGAAGGGYSGADSGEPDQPRVPARLLDQ